MLYKGLRNDTFINGEVVSNHSITNGVTQGDALFILAMEPLIRNIENNIWIKSIDSELLQYKWPKVLGYADNITCITKNDDECKQVWETHIAWVKSNLLLNIQMYNMSSLHKYN